MADQNNTTNHTGESNVNGYPAPGNNTPAAGEMKSYSSELGYYTVGDDEEPFRQILKEGNYNASKVLQRNMSHNPSAAPAPDPDVKRPHTHIPQYDLQSRGTYEKFVDYLQDSADRNMGDATCRSPEHKPRSGLSRLWSYAKGVALSFATGVTVWAGTKIGWYTERDLMFPPVTTPAVTTMPQSPSIKKYRFNELGNSVITVSPSDPDDPGTGTSDWDADGTLTNESGSRADLKGTPLDGIGRYVYYETTAQWVGYGSRCNTVVKIVIDTEEMTAKITFERGDFKADDDGSPSYKAEKAFFARQPAIVECTCKVNRKFYLHDRRDSDSYIDASEYDTYMTYSWPRWRNIDGDKYHFLLNFTDFQWTGEPFITSAMFNDTDPEPYRISRIGILEKDKGKLPVMRMFTVDGRSDYYISFVVSRDGDTGVPGIISINDTFHQFVEQKEYTGGAPGAASGPTMPAATPTPTPTPTPVLIEPGKPQVTVNGGGTVTAGDDGSVSITPDTGKKIGQLIVNDNPLPVPPDGQLTGFTPEDKVEVRFIGEDEPMPTLPPAQTINNGSGGGGNGGSGGSSDGGNGGNGSSGDGGNDGNGGSGNSGGGNGGSGGSGDGGNDGNGGSGNSGGGGNGGNSGSGNTGDNGSGSSGGNSGGSGDSGNGGNGSSGGNGGSGNSGSSGDGGNSGSGSQPTPPPGPRPSINISLTRAQLLNLLWAYKGCPEAWYTTNPFVDVSESDYYYQAVLWALEAGLIEANPGSSLEPNRVCTFNELAPIMQRYYRMF